jgi:hypothetical protein
VTSTLSWIDHDAAERDRMQRVLQLFRERDTRDELGLGSIRDSFADALFPGTSTIQTRLRYFLFIPWAYTQMENRRVPADRFADEGRNIEMRIRASLLESEDTAGVFGKEAGRELKRLASSVYWAGLKTWGLRGFQRSQDEYHRTIGSVYGRRRTPHHRDDGELIADPRAVTWHPDLPPPPDGFPNALSLRLEHREAEFLRDLIARYCRGSLLAVLSERTHTPVADVRYPWEHPELGSFPTEHRALLEQARLFSAAMNGAAILYNIMLAELSEKDERQSEHRDTLAKWASSLDLRALSAWRLDDLWAAVLGGGHTITVPTQRFITDWVTELLSGPGALSQNENARGLIRARERRLKGARSRFTNRRALDQWGGSSGIAPLNFRWQITRQLLTDLHVGLGAP